MSQDNNNKILTPQMLREYLYGECIAPFWNYDPSQLTYGLELEYFIGFGDEQNFELAGKKDFLKVCDDLCAQFGFKGFGKDPKPGHISKDTELGYIAIKPDFSWHVLEIAFPPRSDINDIRTMLETNFDQIDHVLAKYNLKRLDFSCLPSVPESMDVINCSKLKSSIDLVSTFETSSKFFHELFPALIAATQVHLNVSDESALAMLPSLYRIDAEVESKYCRIQTFKSETSNLIRRKLYENSLGDQYLLKTTPKVIPYSIDSYTQIYNQSLKLFPEDEFFNARDLSYIRPTRHGTFEFRSACSYKDINKIIEIIEARKEQFLRAYNETLQLNRVANG